MQQELYVYASVYFDAIIASLQATRVSARDAPRHLERYRVASYRCRRAGDATAEAAAATRMQEGHELLRRGAGLPRADTMISR